jgi:acid phosphatase type 7
MKTSFRIRVVVCVTALAVGWLVACRAGWAAENLLANAEPKFALVKTGAKSTWQSKVLLTAAGNYAVRARIEFQVNEPVKAAGLALRVSSVGKRWTLNGKPIPLPLDGMRYEFIPGIPPSMLVSGANELEGAFDVSVSSVRGLLAKQEFRPSIALLAQTEADLAFRTGPIVGWTGRDFFTVTCRTTIPCVVTLKSDGKTCASPSGLMHRLRIDGLKPDTAYEYSLTASLAGGGRGVTAGPYTTRTFPASGPLVFAAVGDSRTNPATWRRIAEAIRARHPAFAVHTGDFVGSGANDQDWDTQFWEPAKEMLASVPFYPVIGNHEEKSPILPKVFSMPEGRSDWSQRIGPVLWIGGDAKGKDWEEGGKSLRWLADTLQASRDEFVFMGVHYPPWSSGLHGNNKLVQKQIMPILDRYDATALVAGHDHNYERSERDKATTTITTGGGGAPKYPRSPLARNPYSKVFKATNHYAIFTVDGGRCTMQVYDLKDQVLDTQEWKARAEASTTTAPQE